MNAALKPLETRRVSLGIQSDDLTVEDDGRLQIVGPRGKRIDELGELSGLLVADT